MFTVQVCGPGTTLAGAPLYILTLLYCFIHSQQIDTDLNCNVLLKVLVVLNGVRIYVWDILCRFLRVWILKYGLIC